MKGEFLLSVEPDIVLFLYAGDDALSVSDCQFYDDAGEYRG